MMNTPADLQRHGTGWRGFFFRHPEIWITVGLFFASCLWRGLSGWYTRRTSTYYDEMVYWSLARSLFHGQGLSLYELPAYYDKFIYSLVISPLFFIANSATRMKALVFLNSVLISSSLFPAYFLSRRMTESGRIRILSLILFCLWPDLFYAHTGAMAENLYLPLSLWLILLHADLLKTDKAPGKSIPWGLSFLTGFLTYVTYMVKAGASGFAAAFFLMMVCRIIRPGKRNRKAFIWTLVAYLLPLLIGEFLCRLLMGNQSAYDSKMRFWQIASLYRAEYFVYALIIYVLFLAVSWFFFPIFLPWGVENLRKNGSRSASVLSFVLFSLLFTLLGTVFTITMREDVGSILPRIHTRYFIPFSFPLILGVMEWMSHEMNSRSRTAIIAGMLFFAVPFLFLPRIVPVSGVDSLVLYPFRFQGTFDAALTEGSEELRIHQYTLLVRGIYIVFGAVVNTLVCCRKRKAAIGLFCAFVVTVSLFNSWTVVGEMRGGHQIPLNQAVACAEMDQDIADVTGDEALLVIVPDDTGTDMKILDSYLSMSFSMTTSESLSTVLNEDHEVDLLSVPLPAGMKAFLREETYRGRDFSYILCPDSFSLGKEAADLVRTYEDAGFNLYKLRKSSFISIDRMYPYADEPAQSYSFEHRQLLTDNVQGCFPNDGTHVWAGKHVHARILGGRELHLKLETSSPFVDEHHPELTIYVNGELLERIEIRSEATVYSISLPLDAREKKILELDLECSASFIPTWYDSLTTDTREVCYVLKYLGVDPNV